jgi:hypothetical protein
MLQKENKMREVQIIVAAHKRARMPKSPLYLPMHVGKKGKEDIGYLGDDTGENISEKNPYYCELTGLYWAWKNLDADYLGLVHYRRYFSARSPFYRKRHGKENSILTLSQLQKILQTTDIILPKKRRYWIQTTQQHYCSTHYPEPLLETEKIIQEQYPQMIDAYKKVMQQRSAHMFNMYIMKRELSDAYCEWLFDVLETLETRIDISSYDAFQARVYGRISELLLNVWILYHHYSFVELPVMHMESVNWLKKGFKYLKSVFFHQYY